MPKPVELRVMGDRIVDQIRFEARAMSRAQEAEYLGSIYGVLESRLGELDLDEEEGDE